MSARKLSTLDHDEARRELTGMLTDEFAAIPTPLLVDHLVRAYGDAGWPVLREAARALVRRWSAVEAEQLELAARPRRGGPLGHYATRRRGERPRPYRTVLRAAQPIAASCDCPDFVKGGLGLCKHVLVVLAELARDKAALRRASTPKQAGPALWWDPILPMTGPNDWLAGVRARDRGALPAGLQRGLAAAPDATARRGVVARLAAGLRGPDADPALRVLVDEALADVHRTDAIGLTNAALDRALRGFRLRLYPYQRHAVERFLATGRLLLADDMGLGKTIQAAAIAHALVHARKLSRVLVIAPASLKSQWVREWRRATDVPIEIVEGGPDTRADTYAGCTRGVLVANYEQVLRDLDRVAAHAPELVVLDEAQRIKNWETKTARTIKRIDAPYRLVLTGTPLENRLDELASIMDWIDPRALAPKWRLAPAHQVVADSTSEIVGMRDLDVIRQRLAPRVLRRRRSEILTELPPRTDTVIPVELTEPQRAEHDELAQPIANLLRIARKRGLTRAQFLRLMSLLATQRIIANGLGQLNFESIWPTLCARRPDEATLESLASPKLARLRELVGSIVVDQGRKVVVFSQWRRMLTLAQWATSDLLEAGGVRSAFLSGQESQRRRTQNIVDFHDDPSLRVLLCTDAGGVGLNLQRAASCCINLELPWNPAVLEQRIARIHRMGQPEPVDVYALVSEQSIEARIAAIVGAKKALFTGLFDGGTDEIRFDGSGGFLGMVERLVEPDEPTAAQVDDDDSTATDLDAADPDVVGAGAASPAHVDRIVEAADEHREPAMTPAASLPAPAEVRALFSELRIEPREDGGVRIDASPRAAATLGALFRGMAGLLEQTGA